MNIKIIDAQSNTEAPIPVSLFDIPFDPLTQAQTLAIITDRLEQGKSTRIVTINPEFVLTAEKNPEFKQVLQTADLHLADGAGILWATNFLKKITNYELRITNWIGVTLELIVSLLLFPFFPKRYQDPLPERVTGSDLFAPLMNLLAQKSQSIFLLGAAPGVAEAVANQFRIQHSAFRIHTYSGSPNESDAHHIIKLINDSQASALFVAFQFPKQDTWIAEHLVKMPTIKVAMGVGGTFDFIVGGKHVGYGKFKARRAPQLFRNLHLEWLWRLVTQPYRLKRIFRATFGFIWKVYKEKLRITNY
ncbi:MAG: WecB/TagA/CpsF family glycosyltransferase [Candidatus Abawacabacteria bacterium]|nr:WecB/TagA/CpsF family glycosyltransferase [Candidatus Abawacabacteria bacterium]